jgi:predicted kinase
MGVLQRGEHVVGDAQHALPGQRRAASLHLRVQRHVCACPPREIACVRSSACSPLSDAPPGAAPEQRSKHRRRAAVCTVPP